MTGIYELTLRTKDGRERRTLAWFPTEAVRQDYYDKAARRGLTVTENKKILMRAQSIRIYSYLCNATTENF